MEIAFTLLQELLVMMLIMGIGFSLVRLGILAEEDCKLISTVVLYVCLPSAIINSFLLPMDSQRMHGLLLATGFAVIVHIVWITGTTLLHRRLPLTGVDMATMIYSNSGNLVYPLVALIFGSEYVFYAAPFNAVMTVFIWTHARSIIKEEPVRGISSVFKNFNILATFVGLILFLLQLSLPPILKVTLDLLSGMLGPASMIVIGMILAGANLKRVFTTARLYAICLCRLILYPLVVIVMVALSGYLKVHPEDLFIFQIAMIAVAAPPANIIAQFAVMYDKDALMAGSYNALGMLLCIVTMPLMMLIFDLLVK